MVPLAHVARPTDRYEMLVAIEGLVTYDRKPPTDLHDEGSRRWPTMFSDVFFVATK